jgi:3-hydroxyacyl-[acyl-carrier-protein] dehydratase
MPWQRAFRRGRRQPLLETHERPVGPRLDRDDLARILPHRDPLLLLDAVTGVDAGAGVIVGTRHLDGDDPVFRGHFPDAPVYPGSLQLEMAGQLALCLHRLQGASASPSQLEADEAFPAPVFVTGVLGAAFLRPLRPGDTATVLARTLDQDALLATALVQTLRGEEVCSAAVLQVLLPEGVA